MVDLLKKSVFVLKKVQHSNGSITATLKDGGYPYVYTRDGVIVTKALNAMGLFERSERFYYFMRKYSKLGDYSEVFQRYNVNGLPAVTRKDENDNEGLLLHGIYDTFLHNKKEIFIDNMWDLIFKTANLLISYSSSGLVKTKTSIHEFEALEKGYEIWSNCAAYRGLKDACEMAKVLGHEYLCKKWGDRAEEILKNINKRLFDKKKRIYLKNTRFPDSPDISILSPFYFGLIDSKPLLKKTLSYLRKHLWDSELGGFRRFRKFENVKDWHWYNGGSGSWVLLTCWAARFYQRIGDKKNHDECLKWVEEVGAKSGGFLPEHISRKEEYEEWKEHEIEFNRRIINEMKKAEKTKKFRDREVVYWANPLAWSHAEYILLKKENESCSSC